MRWQRVVAAFELHRLVGDRHLDPELLRLAERAAHQRHAGNAGREAEIILDPRRGAGLAAERAAIEREHGQPLRAGIDRGGEPGRAGADDDHVVTGGRGRSARPGRCSGRAASSVGLRSSWPPGQSTIGSSSGSTWKRSISVSRAAVAVRVELLVGMAVAAQEVDQPKHVGVAVAADDRPARRRRSRSARPGAGSARA